MDQCCSSCAWVPQSYRRGGTCKRVLWSTLVTTLVLFVVLLTIILLSLTVNKTVAQDEYAVFENQFTTRLDGVHTQGAYVLRVGDVIHRFKRTFQHKEYDKITCLSADQLPLLLTVSLQFQYEQSAVIPVIMMDFGTEEVYSDFFSGIIESSIISTCGNFSAEQYYTERSYIESALYHDVVANVENAEIGLNIPFLQLKNIDFPNDFAAAITQKQTTQQQAVTQMNARTSQLITANTTLITSQQQAQIMLITANNTARINLEQALLNANVVQTQLEQRAEAYHAISLGMNLNQSELIQYIEYEVMRLSTGRPLVELSSLL